MLAFLMELNSLNQHDKLNTTNEETETTKKKVRWDESVVDTIHEEKDDNNNNNRSDKNMTLSKNLSPRHGRLAYVYSPQFAKACNVLPIHPQRSLAVHSLIEAYDLMKKMDIIAPSIADETDLALFHHKNYIIKLQQVSSKNGKKHTISSHRQRLRQHNKKRSRDSDEEDDTDDDDDDDEGSNSDSSSSNYEREDERDYDPRNIEQRKEMEQFGLDDCQPFQGVFDYVCWVAGGSLSAAKLLMPIKLKTKTTTVQHPSRYNIAINWEGGRHHARKEEAAGFCYVNDIVLAILELLKSYRRVMYIDIDVHHGDGVEQAFLFTDRVLTVSFHQYGPGLYPGTGSLQDIGKGKGKYYAINVPLKDGVRDDQYVPLFKDVVESAYDRFRPQVIVLVCGADSIYKDPLGKLNLTVRGYEECARIVGNLVTKSRTKPENTSTSTATVTPKAEDVATSGDRSVHAPATTAPADIAAATGTVAEEGVKLLVLGGGGYNIANTARCWASMTSVFISAAAAAAGKDKGGTEIELPNDIPDHDCLKLYAPDFKRHISEGRIENYNTPEYLAHVRETVLSNIAQIRPN